MSYKQRTLPLPPLELLNERFKYEDGKLIYIKHISSNARPGMVAGCPDDKGYWGVLIKGKRYKVSRIIWKMMTGKDPEHEIDHINHKRDDNRIENLRDVPGIVNEQHKSTTVANGGLTRVINDEGKSVYTEYGKARRRAQRKEQFRRTGVWK